MSLCVISRYWQGFILQSFDVLDVPGILVENLAAHSQIARIEFVQTISHRAHLRWEGSTDFRCGS